MKKSIVIISVALISLVNIALSSELDFVWLEGENPTSANFKTQPADDEKQEALYPALSEGKRLNLIVSKNKVLTEMPKEGYQSTYEFDIQKDGEYSFWMRICYEWARSPIDWRIDDGEWQTFSNNTLTENLVSLSKWNEVAWAKAGIINLKPGESYN